MIPIMIWINTRFNCIYFLLKENYLHIYDVYGSKEHYFSCSSMALCHSVFLMGMHNKPLPIVHFLLSVY